MKDSVGVAGVGEKCSPFWPVVLRLSGRAKRPHRLEEIAGMDRNLNASVAAIKAAEQLADEPARSGQGAITMPGLVIIVTKSAPAPSPVIDVTPAPAAEDEPGER
jgi:hypothetical protein